MGILCVRGGFKLYCQLLAFPLALEFDPNARDSSSKNSLHCSPSILIVGKGLILCMTKKELRGTNKLARCVGLQLSDWFCKKP